MRGNCWRRASLHCFVFTKSSLKIQNFHMGPETSFKSSFKTPFKALWGMSKNSDELLHGRGRLAVHVGLYPLLLQAKPATPTTANTEPPSAHAGIGSGFASPADVATVLPAGAAHGGPVAHAAADCDAR